MFEVMKIPDAQMNARTKLVFMFTGREAASRNSRGVANLPNIAIAEGTGLTEDAVSEIMQDRQTGFLEKLGDVASMTRHVIKLASDPALSSQLGTAARARAREHFSAQRSVSRYLEYYCSIMHGCHCKGA